MRLVNHSHLVGLERQIDWIRSSKNSIAPYQYAPSTYMALGEYLAEELSLDSKDIQLLEYFYPTTNRFESFGTVLVESVKLYLECCHYVDRKCVSYNSNLFAGISVVNHTWATEERRWEIGGELYNHHVNSREKVLGFLFEKSKNAVRRTYGFFIYPDEKFSTNRKSNSEYEQRIGRLFDEALDLCQPNVSPPDQQLLFNCHAHYHDYWKVLLQKAEHQKTIDKYRLDLLEIGRLNSLNRHLSHVLWGLHRSSASRTPQFSVGLYLLYLKYDSESVQPAGHDMFKKNARSIFNAQKDVEIFNSICGQFLIDKDFNSALSLTLGLCRKH
jgi:hypothetical protein